MSCAGSQVGIPGAQTSLTLVNWFDEMPPGSLRGLVIDCEDLFPPPG